MNRGFDSRRCPLCSGPLVRGALLAAGAALYLLCPDNASLTHHWSYAVPWLNPLLLFSVRQMCLGPVCWGLAVFLLLGCGDAWLRRQGAAVRVSGAARGTAAALACVMLAAGGYWTWGFSGYSVLPPMPFELGYFIMNHTFVLGVWWSVCALALHLALPRPAMDK